MDIPPSLAEKIRLFRAHGTLRESPGELWTATSWQSVFEGVGVRPKNYYPKVDNLDYAWIEKNLRDMEAAISDTVQGLPKHDQYLRERFRAV
jgi:tryptophan halogenase